MEIEVTVEIGDYESSDEAWELLASGAKCLRESTAVGELTLLGSKASLTPMQTINNGPNIRGSKIVLDGVLKLE